MRAFPLRRFFQGLLYTTCFIVAVLFSVHLAWTLLKKRFLYLVYSTTLIDFEVWKCRNAATVFLHTHLVSLSDSAHLQPICCNCTNSTPPRLLLGFLSAAIVTLKYVLPPCLRGFVAEVFLPSQPVDLHLAIGRLSTSVSVPDQPVNQTVRPKDESLPVSVPAPICQRLR